MLTDEFSNTTTFDSEKKTNKKKPDTSQNHQKVGPRNFGVRKQQGQTHFKLQLKMSPESFKEQETYS